MVTLLQHLDGLNLLVGHVFAFFDPAGMVAALDTNNIMTKVQNFLLPLVFLAVGAISIKFLVQRQMTQFFQFAGIAILVIVLMTQPQILQSVSNWVATLFK